MYTERRRTDAWVTLTVGIGPRDDGQGFGIDVDLTILVPGIERPKAEDLVAKAPSCAPTPTPPAAT